MNGNKLVYITATLLVAALGSIFYREYEVRRAEAHRGIPALDPTLLAQIDQFVMEEKDKRTEIKKNSENRWVVLNTNFPASANKISESLSALSRKLSTDLVNQQPTPGLGFETPFTYTFYSQGKEVAQLKVGGKHSGGGQYAVLKKGGPVYLLGEEFNLDLTPEHWELHTLYDLKHDEVHKIRLIPRKSAKDKREVLVVREKPGAPLKLSDLKSQEKEKKSQYTNIIETLKTVHFHKAIALDDKEALESLKDPVHAEVITFSGRVYSLTAGNNGKKDSLRAFVRIKYKKEENADPAVAAHLNFMNQLADEWIFETGPNVEYQMSRPRDAFLEKDEPKKPKKVG